MSYNTLNINLLTSLVIIILFVTFTLFLVLILLDLYIFYRASIEIEYIVRPNLESTKPSKEYSSKSFNRPNLRGKS